MSRTAITSDAPDVASNAAVLAFCRRRVPVWVAASCFLPRAKRAASCAVLALLVQISDAVSARDVPAGSSNSCCSPGGIFAQIEDRLASLYSDNIELPLPEFRDETQHVFYAASQAVRQYDIPLRYLRDFASGCVTDSSVKRYATWAALQKHCEATGGAVALIGGCVLGATHSDVGGYLTKLGCGLRLTMILGNLARDHQADRIYLPLEDMVRLKCSEKALLTLDERCRPLIAFEVERARGLMREGLESLPRLAGNGSRLAAGAVIAKAAAELQVIYRDPLQPFRSMRSTSLGISELTIAWQLARWRAGSLPRSLRQATDQSVPQPPKALR